MFVKVIGQNCVIYYFPVTEISYMIEENHSCTVVMKKW